MMPDPVQIFGSYMNWKVNEDTWVISFMGGSQFMYLLEGNEKALLIDTGWGAGNLRSYVEKLTDKPILVANTHGHLDHSGGNGEWESVIMLPGAEIDLFTCYRLPFDVSKLPYPNYEHKLVSDGDSIDLGGRVIEFLDISAHSNGSLAFLDRKNGYLFVGDELESTQVIMNDSEPIPGHSFELEPRLQAHRRNMLRLKGLQGAWHTIFPAHNGAPIAPSYLDDYIALVEHIYHGDAIIDPKLNHVHIERENPNHNLCRIRWEKASFFTDKTDLSKVYGSGSHNKFD